MDDRDYSSTLLLVEHNQNDVESTLAALSEGRPIEGVFIARDAEGALGYILRRAAYRSQAAVGVAQVGPAGRWLRVNDKLCEITGYARDELLEKTFQDIIHHEDTDADLAQTRRLLNGEIESYSREKRYVRKGGSPVWIDLTISIVKDLAETPRYFVSVMEDITGRKRAEKALRNSEELHHKIEEQASENIFVVDLENRNILEADAAVQRSLGFTLEDQRLRIRFTPEAKAARRTRLENEEQQLFRLRRHPGSEDYLCLPIGARDRIVGVLEAYGQESLAQGVMTERVSNLTSQATSALENAWLYKELGDRERALQHLVKRLLGAQEEERRRVAYEVHDGLAQVAVAAHQNLQAFARRHTPETEQGRRELDRILGQVRTTVSDARRIIANLRPTALDDLGLAAAISLEVERLNEEGYHVDCEEHLGDERLPREMEIALFRVAQEALTNIRKHAGTKWLKIELRRRDGEVYLEVRDFGCGFDPAALETLGGRPGERVGFAGMRERVGMLGGELEIQSRPEAGTFVAALIPLMRTA